LPFLSSTPSSEGNNGEKLVDIELKKKEVIDEIQSEEERKRK
jgi:hypothetical protein